jgi:hypothetical protein
MKGLPVSPEVICQPSFLEAHGGDGLLEAVTMIWLFLVKFLQDPARESRK